MSGIDVTLRHVPGFTWLRFVVTPTQWKRGTWWATRGIVKVRAFGPMRVVTMRTDCIERAYASGALQRDGAR